MTDKKCLTAAEMRRVLETMRTLRDQLAAREWPAADCWALAMAEGRAICEEVMRGGSAADFTVYPVTIGLVRRHAKKFGVGYPLLKRLVSAVDNVPGGGQAVIRTENIEEVYALCRFPGVSGYINTWNLIERYKPGAPFFSEFTTNPNEKRRVYRLSFWRQKVMQ